MLTRIVLLQQDAEVRSALEKALGGDVFFDELTSSLSPTPMADACIGQVTAENAGAFAGQVASGQAVLQLLAQAIDCRESFKPFSAERVLDHASRFATALGLSPEDRYLVERGALLRDLGKLRIDNAVLAKDSLLTYDEYNILQDHTVFGAETAEAIPGLARVAPILRHHHENFDGTGYPDKLRGEDIPRLARLVKIVDVYCAMTSPRPYRNTVATKDDALAHFREERGKHFDPELTDAFIDGKIAGDPIAESAD